MSVYHDIEKHGLKANVGKIVTNNKNISLLFMDQINCKLNRLQLENGNLPTHENEIVVSKSVLQVLNNQGQIGDTIDIPYQIYRNGGLDFEQKKEFTIVGILKEDDISSMNNVAIVSEEFLHNEIPEEQITYDYQFQVKVEKHNNTVMIENKVNEIEKQFAISESDCSLNKDYIMANYVDPSIASTIILIIVIIVIAGIITIYSIYYVGISERVQGFGKLKAIGATKKQLKQIVLREGFFVAAIGIGIGLLIGTVISKYIILKLIGNNDGNLMSNVMEQIVRNNEISFYYWWIYLGAVLVAFITVYLWLIKPIRIILKRSDIEALRYQTSIDNTKKGKISRKSNKSITLNKISQIYLFGNKKNSIITILSMGITGVFVIVVSTILSCANPIESTNSEILGQYRIELRTESGNKEHPEREWSQVIKNNPLNNQFLQRIEQIKGIKSVSCFRSMNVISDTFEGDKVQITGVPKEYEHMLMKGIVKGSVSIDDLRTGDIAILSDDYTRWYPNTKLGDVITVTYDDGEGDKEKDIKIAAIGEYDRAFSNYSALLMVSDGIDQLTSQNVNDTYNIFASERYNEETEKQLQQLIESSKVLALTTWKSIYNQWKTSLNMTRGICFSFLGILGAICVMNMINTMINSVHQRKKEFGMMQAIGLTEKQLIQMLQIEGLFYTAGTLILSIGIGSLLGYPIFLWAREKGIFNIMEYHYPTKAAAIVAILLFLIQVLLAFALGKSVKKDSIIERIRLNE